ncbi:ATP-binding protein [Azospirillum argentinense]
MDDALYQPIAETVAELEVLLERIDSGYVALVGSPGSGKSTTLTKTFRYRKGFRIVRYYAFVPDGGVGRGEALNFLHDLVLQLRRHGIRGAGRSLGETREELLSHLAEQFRELHSRYQDDGVKTLILVDGLDHIEREQAPERTLLSDLPAPQSVPAGVIFILGSQKLQLTGLPTGISVQLRPENHRTLTVRPLPRAAVRAVAAKVCAARPLSEKQIDTVCALSGGHPLALAYLLKRLQVAPDAESIDAILSSADVYGGSIEELYQHHWQVFEDQEDLRGLLALLARLRGPFNPKIAQTWATLETFKRFLKQARHYFREDSSDSWRFFHNSFRQFILHETGRDLFGDIDPEAHRRHHARLADLAIAASPCSPFAWEELYHRAQAGDYEAVLRLGTQTHFRRQFFNWRSLDDISEDLTLCFRAVAERLDPLAIVRLLLIEHELDERDEHLREADLWKVVLALDGPEALERYVLRDGRLLISLEALELAGELAEMQAEPVARRIFEAAEPLEVLSGSKPVGGFHDEHRGLKRWARAAPRFRPLSEILTVIANLEPDSQDLLPQEGVDDARQKLRMSLLTAVVDAVYAMADPKLLEQLRQQCIVEGADAVIAGRIDWLDVLLGDEKAEHTHAAFNRLNTAHQKAPFAAVDRLVLARFALMGRQDKQLAEDLLEGIEQPECVDALGLSDRAGLWAFSYRIRFNRLLAALGRPVAPAQAVPNAENERDQGSVLFERVLVLLATIQGRQWFGASVSPTEFLRTIRPVLHLYCREWRETQSWTSWHVFQRLAPELFDFAIDIAAGLGAETVALLADVFDAEWDSAERGRYWRLSLRRHIALSLFGHNNDADALRRRLEAIEAWLAEDDDLHDRVNGLVEQIVSWGKAGDIARGRALVARLFETSFGVYHDKDYQIENWAEWLGRVNEVAPVGAVNRIQRFVGALAILKSAHRGNGVSEATRLVLESAARLNPGLGVVLRRWLLDQHGADFDTSLEGLLRGLVVRPDASSEMAAMVAGDLLIPFQGSVDEISACRLAEAAYLKLPVDKADAVLRQLSAVVATEACPSNRFAWRSALADGCRKVGAVPAWLNELLSSTPPHRDTATRPSITLRSGETLTDENVMERVHSYRDLVALLEEVVEDASFPWHKAVDVIVSNLSADEARDLAQRLNAAAKGRVSRALLARRLAILGHGEEAWRIAEPLLAKSKPGGWDPRYDGGSRVTAFEALVAVDPVAGRARAIRQFVADFIGEYRYPRELIWRLDRIAPLLFEEVPVASIWKEFEEHIYQLHEFSMATPIPDVPADLSMTSEQALVAITFDALALPVPDVRDRAFRTLCTMLGEGTASAEIDAHLDRLLNGASNDEMMAFAMIDAVQPLRPDVVSRFADRIVNACIAPSMSVRIIARRLAQCINITPMEIPAEHGTLPAVYSLRLPDLAGSVTRPHRLLKPGEVLSDTDDPQELLRPFVGLFAFLSRCSNIPVHNLLSRAATFMRQEGGTDHWGKAAEKTFQDWLSGADLEITYTRLRPAAALRAFDRVVAEMLDAGALDDQVLRVLGDDLLIHERVLSLRRAEERPHAIALPAVDGMRSYPRKDWVDASAEAAHHLARRLADGRIVLGEMSAFKKLDWEQPREIRLSMMAMSGSECPANLGDAPWEFFPGRTWWSACDYPRLGGSEDIPATVVKGRAWRAIGGTAWLALNPALGFHLGWRFDRNGLFRWMDKRDRVMVESHFWRDGPLFRQKPNHRDICGEGWLVVAAPAAAEAILGAMHGGFRAIAIARAYTDQETKVVRTSVHAAEIAPL